MIQKSISQLNTVIDEVCAISDESLKSVRLFRRLRDEGYFDIEHGYDYLIALGLGVRAIYNDDDVFAKDRKTWRSLDKAKRRIGQIVSTPDLWMQESINDAVDQRYFSVTQKHLPALNYERIPRRLSRRFCKQSDSSPLILFKLDYCRLQYILDMVVKCGITLKFSDQDLSCFLTMTEFRDFIAAMERPPQDILDELTAKSIEYTVERMNTSLKSLGRYFPELKRLGYKADSGATAAEPLRQTANTLMEFIKDDEKMQKRKRSLL